MFFFLLLEWNLVSLSSPLAFAPFHVASGG